MKKSYAVGLFMGVVLLWLVSLNLNKVGVLGSHCTASRRVTAPTSSSGGVHARDKASRAKLFSSQNGEVVETNFGSTRAVLEGELDAGYVPELLQPGDIYAMALQTDGKVIIGGESFKINGVRNHGLARLNADGSTDTSFNARPIPDTNIFDIYAIAIQPDGKVLIGGTFGNVNGTALNNIARLNADGSVDTSFLNGLAGASGTVRRIVLQPDGKILIGGTFSNVNGTTCNNIARLNGDGSLDTSFANGLTGTNFGVTAIALQPDGKVVIGGSFSSVNGTTRNRIARLNSDGSLDTTFLNGMSGLSAVCAASVQTIALQPDGKLLIGGGFDSVNGTARNSIARLNADGTLDTTFAVTSDIGCTSVYEAILLQADGKAIISGRFGSINGTTRKRIARLNADGTLETTFLNGQAGMLGSVVRALALQPNGTVVAGGNFSRVNGIEHHSTVRLSADGTLDSSFNGGHVDVISSVGDIALQPDGKSIIAGSFTTVNGVIRHHIARLNADGSLDTGFSSDAAETDGVVEVELQTDGKILIGGSFTVINGVTRNRIARLNSDGTLDATFANGQTGANGLVTSIAVRVDGQILIGGDFTNINGTTRNRVARLFSDGAFDGTFLNPDVNFLVNTIILQADNKPIIGGRFTTVGGVARNRIARLGVNGTLDTTFLNGQAGASSEVLSLVLQPDGKILAGGLFAKMNGIARLNIARLNSDGTLDTGFTHPNFQTTFIGDLSLSPVNTIVMQPDGKILIGGQFIISQFPSEGFASRSGLVRLNADGALDTACITIFDLDGDGLFFEGAFGTVNAVTLQADGKVLFGGGFQAFNNVERFGMARTQPTLCLNHVSVSEGNSGTTNTTFTVSLSGFLTQSATVQFATANGTATAGSDYIANSGTLTFNPGDTSKPITISLNGDIAVEPDETFFVNLTNPTNTTLARDQGTGTILNDDTPCTLTCPPNQTIDIGSSAAQCGALVNYSAPTTSGSCGTVTCAPPTGSLFPVGTTTVNCLAANNASCSFTVTVTNSFALSQTRECFTPATSNGSVNVSASQGCNWTAMSHDSSFIAITAGANSSGNGTVNYSVAANTVSTRRTGTMTIAGQVFTVLQGAQYNDVPTGHLFYTEIGKLSARAITLGCGNDNYCPNNFVTREQMAAFIIRALGDFNPPPPAMQRFADVPPSNFFYAFIEQMALRQITLGCGSGNYCPGNFVTREQMAAFIIRALHAPGYTPPPPVMQRFLDVPPSNPFYAHIEEMAVRGITLGCGGGNYCPSDFVTRGQMAAFLVRAFGC